MIGTTVLHYQITAKLGGGGMGVVYAARDTRLERRVALKFLPPQWSHDEGAKQRFIREAQAASATDHRNICTIHDIDTAPDGRLFIVMAHYDGQTIKQRLEQGPLAMDEAIEIAAQIAEGLARAHAQGIVHRDIKPGNVIVTDDGVRILDFGLARFVGSLQLTLDGSTIGTVAYMSPEQTRGEDTDGRSDVWSLGVVLYEMLTGTLPFKGAYTEAVAHAVRTGEVPALPPRSGENLEPLERILRRALEKNPVMRYQSGREIARDLRLLQGRTLPLELRSGAVPADHLSARTVRRRRRWSSRAAVAASVLLVGVGVGVPAWLSMPVERVPVLIAPVVNQTGYAELDPYRLALTQELVAQLADSETIRVVPYDRVLQAVRPFRTGGADPSSRDALQALTIASQATLVVVPTLLYETGAWRARVDFRDAATATSLGTFDTPSAVSSLMKETAYRLMPQLTEAVEAHVADNGAPRAAIAASLRRLTGRAAAPPSTTPSLEAAAAFEEGLDAYERMEFAAALDAFGRASRGAPQDPLLLAWRSRTARLMRRDSEAATLAAQAIGQPLAGLPTWKRLFIEAVAAEARRDGDTAAARYQELVAAVPDEPRWLTELAGYQDREELNAEAIVNYQAALARDGRLVRAHVELCRLYNRLNEPAKAKEHATQALATYRQAGDRWLEAQALFCQSDTLRTGGPADREQARAVADQAVALLEQAGARYQLGRAYYYLALAAGAQGRPAESIALGEQSLAYLRQHGNTVLQAQVLGNLGVAGNRLGRRAAAVDYYRQSVQGFEALGDERRAAQVQSNASGIVAEYGGDRERGLREVQNALQVSRKIGDRLFEVFCLQLVAAYQRDAGNHAEAERELRQALALARERDLKDRVTSLTIDLAMTRFETNDVAGARMLLEEAASTGNDRDAPRIRIRLAQVRSALADDAGARADLDIAIAAAARPENTALVPLVNTIAGEIELKAGNRAAARRHLTRAAQPAGELPDASAIQARSSLGELDALDGRIAQGYATARSALEQARAMGRRSLIVRCEAAVARIEALRK